MAWSASFRARSKFDQGDAPENYSHEVSTTLLLFLGGILTLLRHIYALSQPLRDHGGQGSKLGLQQLLHHLTAHLTLLSKHMSFTDNLCQARDEEIPCISLSLCKRKIASPWYTLTR